MPIKFHACLLAEIIVSACMAWNLLAVFKKLVLSELGHFVA